MHVGGIGGFIVFSDGDEAEVHVLANKVFRFVDVGHRAPDQKARYNYYYCQYHYHFHKYLLRGVQAYKIVI